MILIAAVCLASSAVFGQATQPDNNAYKLQSGAYSVSVKDPAQPTDSFLCSLYYEIIDRNAFIVLFTQDSIGKRILLKDNSRIVFTLQDGSAVTTMAPATENTEHRKGQTFLGISGKHPPINYDYYVYTFHFTLGTRLLGTLSRTAIKSGRLYITESQYLDIRGIPSDRMEGSAANLLVEYNKHFGMGN
jgi:hypothetical protein